tara:strand:- start:834 stop:2297 length:1464 start_codon:yes stop_codon:yes gene_type:complete
VPRSIVDQTKAFTGPRGRLEMGGVLVGHVDSKGNNVVVAGLFPRQTEETPGYCEFEGKWMTIACAAADFANESVQSPEGEVTPTLRIIGWIHTHPGLDIFLSSTDVATYNQMLSASPDDRFVAVVVDPLMGKDGVFLTPDMPQTYSSAKGKVRLDRTLRERYLAFLERIESVREKRGREEVPFVITGDLHMDHVSRGFSDDYMIHNLESIHYTKLEVNGIRDDLSDLSSDLDEIRREMRKINSEISKIGGLARKSQDNYHSINDVERGLKEAQDGLSGISRSVGGLERHMRESSNQIKNLRADFSAGESRIDRDISNITNDIVELSENQERDSRNILHTASVIAGLENSIEVQRRRNAQLGDVVEKIGSMARKPRMPSRKQEEKEEWDQLHSKILDPEISNLDILREHFSLIAMNRPFCLAVFKSVRAIPSNRSKHAPIFGRSLQILSDLKARIGGSSSNRGKSHSKESSPSTSGQRNSLPNQFGRS